VVAVVVVVGSVVVVILLRGLVVLMVDMTPDVAADGGIGGRRGDCVVGAIASAVVVVVVVVVGVVIVLGYGTWAAAAVVVVVMVTMGASEDESESEELSPPRNLRFLQSPTHNTCKKPLLKQANTNTSKKRGVINFNGGG